MTEFCEINDPPPYSTLPQRNRSGVPWRSRVVPPLSSTFLRRSSLSLFRSNGGRGGRGMMESVGRESKSCCGVSVSQTVSIRWFIVMIAFVGICCSVVGTVLGALKATGKEHLTVSLLMIGVGIVLITVSGIAWKLTSSEGPTCPLMLGLSSASMEEEEHNGRFLSRPSGVSSSQFHRPQHPYAAMMYSDFQYRTPPPSYQTSMQEYRLRLLLLDRRSRNHPAGFHNVNPPPPPPPPLYSGLRSITETPISVSRPPSYRSFHSETNDVPPTRVHSLSPSSSESRSPESRSNSQSVFPPLSRKSKKNLLNRVSQNHHIPHTTIQHQDHQNSHLSQFHHDRSASNNNNNTSNDISQERNSEASPRATSVCIVTVSGSLSHDEDSSSSLENRPSPGEVEILAHL